MRKKDFRSRTPELQREGKKIMTTPRLILSFFLTTLKNRWTFLPCIFFFLFYFTIFSLRCLVECVYRSALFRFYIYIYFCLFRYDSGMPPQSQKKKCHTTDRFLTVLFVIALSAKNVSRFFFFRFYFFGSLSVTSWFAGSTEDESEEAWDGQKGRKLHEK